MGFISARGGGGEGLRPCPVCIRRVLLSLQARQQVALEGHNT